VTKRTDGELRELARQLVAGKITADEYLKAVLGDPPPEIERLPIRAEKYTLPPRKRLTDAEIDALARRAKALL